MDYSGTYTIWGPPGTGKTTRLSKSVARIVEGGGKVLCCSLTRSAAAEIAGRKLPIPRECVGTLHSHAYRALGGDISVAEGAVKDWNESHPDLRIGSEAAIDVDDPYAERAAVTGGEGDELMAEYSLLRSQRITRDHWPMRVQYFAEQWETWKQAEGHEDFTDLLELALKLVDQAPTAPDVLLVDEAQDHSRLEFDLIRKWAQRSRALLICGDPWQALYCWRGADPSMFDDPAVPATHRDVLSQSYRIPQAVHALAMRWIRNLSTYQPIQYAPRPEPGAVEECPASWRVPEEAIRMALQRMEDGHSVMFAAACGFMLSPTVAWLRNEGIPFANPWRRKRGDWNPIRPSTPRSTSTSDRVLAFLKPLTGLMSGGADEDFAFGWNAPERIEPTPWTIRDLAHWADIVQSRGLLKHGAKKALDTYLDNDTSAAYDPIEPHWLSEWFEDEAVQFLGVMMDGGVSMPGAVYWLTSRLLAAKRGPAEFALRVVERQGVEALAVEPKLYVGTIHSFKGAEADTVFLFPDLSPAGMAEWSGSGSGRDAVVRMFYVGITRARQEVILCRPASARSVEVRG